MSQVLPTHTHVHLSTHTEGSGVRVRQSNLQCRGRRSEGGLAMGKTEGLFHISARLRVCSFIAPSLRTALKTPGWPWAQWALCDLRLGARVGERPLFARRGLWLAEPRLRRPLRPLRPLRPPLCKHCPIPATATVCPVLSRVPTTHTDTHTDTHAHANPPAEGATPLRPATPEESRRKKKNQEKKRRPGKTSLLTTPVRTHGYGGERGGVHVCGCV